jgi:hypothetical protein
MVTWPSSNVCRKTSSRLRTNSGSADQKTRLIQKSAHRASDLNLQSPGTGLHTPVCFVALRLGDEGTVSMRKRFEVGQELLDPDCVDLFMHGK